MNYYKLIFLLLILQFITTDTVAQVNLIKFTPLNFIVGNTDLGFERIFKNNISLGGNLQFWFKDKEKTTKSWIGLDRYSHKVNEGIRGSLELRKYYYKNKIKSSGFNIGYGFSIHYGKHYIKEVGSTNSFYGNIYGNFRDIPKYDISILSGGIGFHFVYRWLLKNGFFTSFELIGKNSWVNQKGDDFPKVIKGFSFQPRFQIGKRF